MTAFYNIPLIVTHTKFDQLHALTPQELIVLMENFFLVSKVSNNSFMRQM